MGIYLHTHTHIYILQFSSVAQLCLTLRPHESQHTRPPCPSPTPGVHSNSCPLSRWCHLILCCPLLLLPPVESFPVSQLFAWGGQNTGVSALASFLPTNSQDWSPLGWTGWISLQSKGLLRVFSNTTVQKQQFFSSLLYASNLTSIHDYWKNHSFDYMNLCWQSNVSAF